jgi:hypothetical protein
MKKDINIINASRHYTIGIDPDVEKNGVAVVEAETKHLECAALSFAQTLDYLQWVAQRAAEVGAEVKVYVEAGWMCASNWHLKCRDNRGLAAAKGVSQGRNEQVSRLLGEMCEHYGLQWQHIKPFKKFWRGKDRKITHEELCAITGNVYGRTNQEMRDASLIAWVLSGLPVGRDRRRGATFFGEGNGQ